MAAGRATISTPPRSACRRAPAWDALEQALADWRHGRTSWEQWCDATDRSRELFGTLVGVPAERVATGASVSYLVGARRVGHARTARACSCRRSTSARSRGRSSSSRAASTSARRRSTSSPTRSTTTTDVVAFSAVQSSDGAVADLDAHRGTRRPPTGVLGRRRHARGRLAARSTRSPLRRRRLRRVQVADVAARHGVPRAQRARSRADAADCRQLVRRRRPLRPLLRPRAAPRRGRAPARPLPRLVLVGRHRAGPAVSRATSASRRSTRTTSRSRTASAPGSASTAGNSAIVSADLPGAEERLARAGIRTAVRGGALRASFHLYNTEDDVDAALVRARSTNLISWRRQTSAPGRARPPRLPRHRRAALRRGARDPRHGAPVRPRARAARDRRVVRAGRAAARDLHGAGEARPVRACTSTGYGLPGSSSVAYGLTCLELEAGDAGVRSACSVQGSLAMFAIWRWGSEEQKERWLPAMHARRGDRLLRPHRVRRRLRSRLDAHARAPRRLRLDPLRLEDVDHERLDRRRRGRLGAHGRRRDPRLPRREGHARASARRRSTASSRCALR